MTSATTYSETAGREFTKRLDELGVSQTTETAEHLGRRAALAVAAESIWEDVLGGLLTSSEARDLIGGKSREALSKQVRTGKVLRLEDAAGEVRYPAWQFDPRAKSTYPAIVELVKEFRRAGLDDWLLASFCVTRQSELAGKTPASVLSQGSSAELNDAAKRAVSALTD